MNYLYIIILLFIISYSTVIETSYFPQIPRNQILNPISELNTGYIGTLGPTHISSAANAAKKMSTMYSKSLRKFKSSIPITKSINEPFINYTYTDHKQRGLTEFKFTGLIKNNVSSSSI